MKELCYYCKYLRFDSCMDGYCSNKEREKLIPNRLVLTDKGCSVAICTYFRKKGNIENDIDKTRE